jgi:hypothetical protein
MVWCCLRLNKTTTQPHKKASLSAVQEWQLKHPGSPVNLLQGSPPNSPDLNPIENVWAWAQARVNKMGCKDFEQFRKAVLDTLDNVPKHMLSNLFASMKKRVDVCISLAGGKTRY